MSRGHQPCPSHRAYRLHLAAGEKPCGPCAQFARDYEHDRQQAAATAPPTTEQLDLARLVARGYTNTELADMLGTTDKAICKQLTLLYENPDVKAVCDGRNPRVGLTAWVYRNGLMDVPDPDAVPPLPPELVRPLLELCKSIVTDRPRGDLRKYAIAALRAARVDWRQQRPAA